MHKFIFYLLLAIAPVAFSQESSTAAPSSPPATSSTSAPPSAAPLSKKDLMARDKIFFVASDTFYVKKEELEKGLLNREEFEKWGLLVTHNQSDADAILYVRRAAFQNNFPYTVTDRETAIVIMGAEVNSLFGTVPVNIARDIVNTLRPSSEPKPNT